MCCGHVLYKSPKVSLPRRLEQETLKLPLNDSAVQVLKMKTASLSWVGLLLLFSEGQSVLITRLGRSNVKESSWQRISHTSKS